MLLLVKNHSPIKQKYDKIKIKRYEKIIKIRRASIGKSAKRNFAEFNEKQAMQWLKGQDIKIKGQIQVFCDIKA